MVKFETRDPFPMLPLGSFSRTEAGAHAANADRWLGLKVDAIELTLLNDGSRRPAPQTSGTHQQLWFGLDTRDLQTPYLEIRNILESHLDCTQAQRVVDLGAAYARMAFVIERHFPQTYFRGFEYVGERVLEARRCLVNFGARRSQIDHVDLTSQQFKIPLADIYFIYDYGTPAAIEKTLHDLKRVALQRTSSAPMTIVARGRVCRYAIESRHATWLSKVDPSSPERAVSVYRSNENALSSVARVEPSM